MAGVNRRKCCCAGCASGACDFTSSSCPNVRVVFSGTVIDHCCNQHGADATTFDGTYILTPVAGCEWAYSSGSGVSDDLNIKSWGTFDCSGTPIGNHIGYTISVSITGSGTITVEMTNDWFAGEVAVGSCGHGPITVTNNGITGNLGTNCNNSGSATVTFCV